MISNLSQKPHILVVDDDLRIRELLGDYLLQNQYYVTLTQSASQARQRMGQCQHDLIIVDVMMPGEDGVTFLHALRQSSGPNAHIPAIMLTARGQVEDRLSGLSAGADDYVPKPFDPQELLLRIQAILRRVRPTANTATFVSFGPWRFIRATRQLFRGEQHVPLTTAEESLLNAFCENPAQIISRQTLAGMQDHMTLERSMDVQINRLRRKIEQDPRHPRYLQTVRHRGYIFYPS